MDGAQTTAGKRKGLQALIKRVSPNTQWTHCVIHREALASRQISPELNKVFCFFSEEAHRKQWEREVGMTCNKGHQPEPTQ